MYLTTSLESIKEKPIEEILQSYYQMLVLSTIPILTQSLIVAGFFEFLPIPAWLKIVRPDEEILFFRLNKAYTEAFGVQEVDVLNKSSIKIWDRLVDEKLMVESDRDLIRDKIVISYINKLFNPKIQDYEYWQVQKWPIIVEDVVVAICGICSKTEQSSDAKLLIGK